MRMVIPVVLAAVTAGCGGSGSSTSKKSAGPYDALLMQRVIRAGEFPGYSPRSGGKVDDEPRAWGQEVGPPVDPDKEAARLRALGFAGGLAEHLTREHGSGEGLSVVERLGSPTAAQQEVLVYEQQGKAAHSGSGDKFIRFSVPAIPDARSYRVSSGGGEGEDVAFAVGPYYYLVGAGHSEGGTDALTQAHLIAAATALHRRVHKLPNS